MISADTASIPENGSEAISGAETLGGIFMAWENANDAFSRETIKQEEVVHAAASDDSAPETELRAGAEFGNIETKALSSHIWKSVLAEVFTKQTKIPVEKNDIRVSVTSLGEGKGYERKVANREGAPVTFVYTTDEAAAIVRFVAPNLKFETLALL